MGYVIEFCGLPGAGKSTIARQVVADLRIQGVPVTDVMAPLGPDAARADRIRRKAVSVAAGYLEPGSARMVREVAFRSGQVARRDQLARPANLLVVRHAVRRARRRPGFSVLDQGPLQEWWSAALRADSDRVLEFARRGIGDAPDLLVRVDAPIPVLVERLTARGARQSRLEGADPVTRVAELERGNLLLNSLFDQLVYSAGVTPAVLRVGGLDHEASTEVVRTAIEASGRGGGS